jgi:hypothetical protein
VVFDLGFSILSICPFFCSSKSVSSVASLFFSFLFFSGGWRASDEPLLMDFIDECAWWMTKVLDDHDLPRKATMFDQAQNVKR